jgi:Type I restriction-modification system methyltransferase subunit
VTLLEQFLQECDLSGAVEQVGDNRFRYKYILGIIDFVSLPDSSGFFQTHIDTWCEDKTAFFVTTVGDGKIHVCDSKTKPSQYNSLRNATICSFDYGENSIESQRYKDWFKKNNIDSGLCLIEIERLIENQKRLHTPVDKDLLENLKERKERIITLLPEQLEKEEVAQKIIDRCLFIRFIEDRAGRNELKKILSSRTKRMIELLKLFDYYNIQLNGDLFAKGDLPSDLPDKIVNQLSLIFGETYVHPSSQRTLQSTLVPYNFSKIPVILISNLYETFLAHEKRRSEGIVFTPENVVDYTLSKLAEDERFGSLSREDTFKVLDPACGSGVFLVKMFEKLSAKRKLSIEEKADLVRKHLFGIDINGEALRIAALSLYLKIIENESPEVINEKLFKETSRHFMFPGLKDINLHKDDSIFGCALKNEKFDLIVGNPPWGYDYSEENKRIIAKNWGLDVSKYQSSQVFLLSASKWMKDNTICALVVNLSNFTNSASRKFREKLTSAYSLKTFVNLSRLSKITFGPHSEPACILIFDKSNRDKIEFLVPDLTKLSLTTKIIMDNNRSVVSLEDLREDDNLWHIFAMGYNQYTELTQQVDRIRQKLNDFKESPRTKEGFEQGLIEWSAKKSFELHMSKETFLEKYRAPFKKTAAFWPYIESLSDVGPYVGIVPNKFLWYGEHLERPRSLELFEGNKLVVTRSWPIKAFVATDTILYNTNFMIFKLNNQYPPQILHLFEAILNSTLAYFYLGVKYRQRHEASFPKVNKEDLGAFPIPDLPDKSGIIKAVIDRVEEIHLINEQTSLGKIKEEIDSLIYDFYDIDYYGIQQINHYLILENDGETTVSDQQIDAYCQEFWKTFRPFLQNGLYLKSKHYISNYHAIVELTVCDSNVQEPSARNILERNLLAIENTEIQQYYETNAIKEDKRVFYEGQRLYIFKANSLKYWTSFMAIKDANEEISLFFRGRENC